MLTFLIGYQPNILEDEAGERGIFERHLGACLRILGSLRTLSA